MSYRSGIGGRLAGHIGAQEPHILCDACGAEHIIRFPPQSWLRNRTIRGWKTLRTPLGDYRWDLCPRCVKGEDL